MNLISRIASFPLPWKGFRAAIGTFFFLQGLCFSSWASQIPTIRLQMRMSHATLGGVLFSLPVGLVGGLLLSGWLVARWGSRQVMVFSTILYGAVLPLIGLTQTTWQLSAALLLLGLWGNLANISMNTQALRVEGLYGRSLMASFHGINSIAGFAGAVIGVYGLSRGLSPFSHFSLISIFVYLSVLLVYRYTLPDHVDREAIRTPFAWPDGKLFKLGLIVFCAMVCEGAMFDWSGVYFQQVVKAPTPLTNLGYLAFMITMAGGRFMGDWLASRFGVSRMIQLNGIGIGAGLFLAVLLPYLPTATLGFLLVGAGVSTIVPLVYGTTGSVTTLPAEKALVAVTSLGFTGFLLGPPLIGILSQATNLQFAFSLVALLGISTSIVIRKVRIA